MFCREQAAQLRDAKSEIERRGAHVAIVGNGGAHFARAFVKEREIDFPVYVDPERVTYKAAGLKRSLASTLRLGAVKNAARALRSGHLQGSVQGDAWQLGGVFVIGPGDRAHLAHVSQEAGDHPPVEEILAVLPAPAS